MVFSIFPDFVAFAPQVFLTILGFGSSTLSEPPEIGHFLPITHSLYTVSHSFFTFGVVAFIVYLLNKRKFVWEMSGWGLHILCDIPTHSYVHFATPFLWPFSSFRVDGIYWSQTWFMILNYSMIGFAYIALTVKHKRKMAKQQIEKTVEA